ncbi:MAG: SDR family oxidoreductase [Thaumarchaeota archaeon]|nr:SDR family oxidoreductase [Nitrososphaerota archaeon]
MDNIGLQEDNGLSFDLMDGKTCIVTGSSSGIGKATALGLAKAGASVILVCRGQEKGEAAMNEIIQKSGNQKVSLMIADLSSQNAIRKLANDLTTNHDKLHVLVNNAGVFLAKRRLTEDGLEMTFAANYLAPFLLTNLLLPTLKASAPSRIVTVASTAHYGATIDFDNLQGERGYSGFTAYSRSKLADIMFTYELARRIEGNNVTANCLHPGVVRTNLGKNNWWMFRLALTLFAPFLPSPEGGARTSIYLATSRDVEGVTGKYFVKEKEAKSKASYDEGVSERLWDVSVKLTHLSE